MKKTTPRNTATPSHRHTAAPPHRHPATPVMISSDLDPDIHLIRLQLAKPPSERTHFLRVPLPTGGSSL